MMAGENILEVGDLVNRLRHSLEESYGDVWVEGEISSWTQPASGHWYFVIKDAKAELQCVMWKPYAQRVSFAPAIGDLVHLRGKPTVYVRGGRLQLVAQVMKRAGEGAMQKAFVEMKQKLRKEGLFAKERKRPIPRFPKIIGVVTSANGAAFQDMRSIIGNRFPLATIVLRPVLVQGKHASQQIAAAIEEFNALAEESKPDVLIVGRGGGSPEDLWAFNEERTARALFASRIPTISAVGHETDDSIADVVADIRAATPSHAAEKVVPNYRDVVRSIRSHTQTLHKGCIHRIEGSRQRVRAFAQSHRFNMPAHKIHDAQQRLDELREQLGRSAQDRHDHARNAVRTLAQRLESLDPKRPLRRGFVRVERRGAPVRAAAQLTPGESVTLHFHDASREATIRD